MNDSELSKKLTWMICLLSANLVVMVAVSCAIVFSLLPKMERVVQMIERVEARFHSFADDVQPVVTAGAGKTIETIKKMDADRLSETATEKADVLMDAATERAKRLLERDKKQKK
jgi:hypothetical protein